MNQNKSVKIRFNGFTEAWEQRKLGDLGHTYGGLSGKSKQDFGHGDARFVTYMNVFSNPIGDPCMVDSIEIDDRQSRVRKGDVLFTTSSETPDEVGMSCVWPSDSENLYLNSFCFGYRPTTKINSNFLASLLRSPSVREKIIFLAQGISRYNISKNKVMEINIPLPSEEEQSQIGDFFTQLDKSITLHQRRLSRFQKIRTTFLQKMFPKNGATKPEIRLPGFNADWEQEKLQNFAVRITRKNIKKQNNRPLTISAQHGLVDQTVYFNNRVAPQDVSNYYLIKKGEFAYNRSTSKDAPVGAVRRLVDYEEGVLSTLYLVFSITDPQHVDPNYLSYFFETTGWHSWILERAAEGARNHGLLNVSSQDFLSLPVMLPSSLEEQQKIGEFFQKIDDCITLLERQVDLLKQIKLSLLQSMFPPLNAE